MDQERPMQGFLEEVDHGHEADIEGEGSKGRPLRSVPNEYTQLRSTGTKGAGGSRLTQQNGHQLARYHSLPEIQITREAQSQPEVQKHGYSAGASRPHGKSRQSRWQVLRSMLLAPDTGKRHHPLLPSGARHKGPTSAAGEEINIQDELLSGPLAGLMLRMYFERDQQDQRRVPVFLHHLKIRVSDSLHPLHNTHAVFRIECEYANGASRWVIYRELRDFISLHTHYRVANAVAWGNRVELPEFPRTSLPYFTWLRKEGREKGYEVTRADFARLQREALENYLIGLIRTTMFHAEANRLCRFFEISTLSVSLAQRGGVQGKAGILRVVGGHTSRKAKGHHFINWKTSHDPKWWLVRDSYMVAVDSIADIDIYDVFLFDADFTIERPKRVYRQGLSFLHLTRQSSHFEDELEDSDAHRHTDGESDETDLPQTRPRRKLFAKLLKSHGNGKEPHKDGASNGEEHPAESTNHHHLDVHDDLTLDPSMKKDPRMVTQQEKKKKAVSQHTFYLQNTQRRLKVVARNERQMHQWIASIERMAARCVWQGKNRFESFAPIRLNAAAQWLVDGRDYFWNLSRALLLAKERIYIQDWWLSPELYMRRPNKEHYRLDQILRKKAREGVKIYVIIYQEVSSRTTPTDSNYTKQRLMGLHPNILVQRSPSHFATGNFYWAHHEKLCVIDEAIAFMGGLDICFGRWDTSQHIMIDQGMPGGHGDNSQVWPGKDYNNGRVADFFGLNKPFEDMHDRSSVPRMPWHDVGVQIVGQPARDICRHFVERWNWLLRVKAHTRVMPFLLPPPDFHLDELDAQGLTGTCEVQICRSCGPWSMGSQNKIELSIQNAYLKAIQMSEHFIYIENQFFVTSTTVDDVKIENKIGDALVSRIIQAHQEGKPWRACIMIPLLPGFAFPIDHSDASSLRIILECQYRTISRGPDSIFARLRQEGIDPDNYIHFFSLRGWGKFDSGMLTTEQVYIHGKLMLVDDRIALIGSANINERSQRGDRDSELLAVIRDTDMIDGRMAGKPYRVGRFVHTLRVRLMREHLGIDVDAIYDDDLMANAPVRPADEIPKCEPVQEQQEKPEDGARLHDDPSGIERGHEHYIDSVLGLNENTSRLGVNASTKIQSKLGFKSEGKDAVAEVNTVQPGGHPSEQNCPVQRGPAIPAVSTITETGIAQRFPESAEHDDAHIKTVAEIPPSSSNGLLGSAKKDGAHDIEGARRSHVPVPDRDARPISDAMIPRQRSLPLSARQSLRKHLDAKTGAYTWNVSVDAPFVDPDGFTDPVCSEFFEDVWLATAVHNTEIYRKVFRCVPDDHVLTWKQYKEYCAWQERLDRQSKGGEAEDSIAVMPSEDGVDVELQAERAGSVAHSGEPDNGGVNIQSQQPDNIPLSPTNTISTETHEDSEIATKIDDTSSPHAHTTSAQGEKRPSRPDEPFEQWERDEMEGLLKRVKGHLVLYPTRFLEGEDMANNFLFTSDRVFPLPIFD
ncbi:phospholipase D [Dacryopinax primogenitus]|uniref:Phospholipase n=1 Tax=Dacryopinax primogenitus (strain DJM 731) TaxID=1858805 RepID=M5FPQ5_DACPD|nr:phospholipase D [Dacryopinax primogenitus]EJT98705.1 phospholipase D [Dacryopinax primogenitus]